VRFEILMSVKITLFWAMTPYRSTLSPSSGLNMESVCSAETLVSTDESTGPHNPERYFKYENLLWMVVKLGLSYERKDIGSGCLKTDCWGECLDFGGRKFRKTADSCITRSFAVCTLCKLLWGIRKSNNMRWAWRVARTRDIKCM
jgi:hypothetical protein